MRKTQSQQPLMVAYIVFLCICGGYYIVSGIFKLEFPVWQRVVAAATIASYFFSLCSIAKVTLKMDKRNLDNISDENILYAKILRKEKNLHVEEEKSTRIAEYISRNLTKNQQDAIKIQTNIEQTEKKVFWLDVVGFLVFFCIMAFDWIFSFFAKSLDWFTLLAFIVMLFVDYMESTKVSLYDELCKSSVNNLKEILTLMEEIDNEQT